MSRRRPTSASFWRSAGVWIAVAGLALTATNIIRSLVDPVGFADYFGAPVDADGTAFVQVYAVRTLFVTVLGVAALTSRSMPTLRLLMASAVVMPLGDLIVAGRAGAAPATLVRHAVIAVFLVSAAVQLTRDLRARGAIRPTSIQTE